MDQLKKMIREVPDFPKPGINFYDITTLLKQPAGLRQTVDALAAEFEGTQIDTVIGIEARGFIFAPALAYPRRRICAGAQTKETTGRKSFDLLRSRVRAGYFGDSPRRDQRRSASNHRRRSAGYWRHCAR